jgi:hypothetical protein
MVLHIYIYIYIYKERERAGEQELMLLVPSYLAKFCITMCYVALYCPKVKGIIIMMFVYGTLYIFLCLCIWFC